MLNVALDLLGAKNFFPDHRLFNNSLDLSLSSGFLNYRCFLPMLSGKSLILFFDNLFVLFDNNRLLDFRDKISVLLVDNWLMDLQDFFLVDDGLMVLMDHILLRLMDHVLVMLHDDILMMFMDDVSVVLRNDGSSLMSLNSSRNDFPIIDSRKLFLLHDGLSLVTEDLRLRLKGSLNHWFIGKNSVLSSEALC